MSRLVLPVELRELLTGQVDPLVDVEVLLLLHGSPERAWRAEEIAQALHVDAVTTAKHLAALVGGRLARTESDPPTYRYAPATPALHDAVEWMRAAYDREPAALVRALYTGPPRAVRSFADAFRLRNRRDD